MKLEELNELKKEASACEDRARRANQMADDLASIRNGETPLMVAYKNMGAWNEDKKPLIEGVINEFGADILRVIEMRQEAYARQQRAMAKQKHAALAAVLGESQE